MKTKILIFVLVFLLFTIFALSAQDGTNTFGEASLAASNVGMYVLGGWAIANMAKGAYGWAVFEREKKYFSQMNLFWNVINLSIAGIALYGNYNTDLQSLSMDELLAKHLNTEKIFLINAGLDVGYMGIGLFLRHLSDGSARYGDLLKGYGNSVILQGGFLLVFDLVMFFVFHNMDPGNMESMSMVLTYGSPRLSYYGF